MEMNDYFTNVKNSTEEEESSLLKRLIALKSMYSFYFIFIMYLVLYNFNYNTISIP